MRRNLNTVLDIGCNFGDFFEVINSRKSFQKYIFFEPDVDNFNVSTERIGVQEGVEGHCCGIFYGATSCRVNGTGDGNRGGYMVSEIDYEHKEERWGGSIMTYPEKVFNLAPLETFISTPADLIKMDIEASEYNVIEHSNIVKNSDNLIIEWHNKPMDYVRNFIAVHLTKHDLIEAVADHNSAFGPHYTFLKLRA